MNQNDRPRRPARDPRSRDRGWDPWPGRGGPRLGPSGPGRGGWPGFGSMPGSRAHKGDVQAAILGLLQEQPMHGYQIIQELAGRSGGAWNPRAGSVYPALQLMQDQELVAMEEAGSKRIFSLTEKGRAAAADAHRRGARVPWEAMAAESGSRLDLRQAIQALFAASAQIERTGTEEQVAKAIELVDQARKAIYLLLAE